MIFGHDVADPFLVAIGLCDPPQPRDQLRIGPGNAPIARFHPMDGPEIVGAEHGLKGHENRRPGGTGHRTRPGMKPGRPGPVAPPPHDDLLNRGDERYLFRAEDAALGQEAREPNCAQRSALDEVPAIK